ncbi:Tfp pilus assembly protein FimT/FimU [Photobacterium sp. BZF1]|uniref:pilus assembly FimT family protein n=1 Tax=Photobacterium sp. BZF1 TaxID=1904457 RepID=UPI001CA3B690|nr:type II secretion system protein [Photobacterium sp. BZF1]
MWASSKTQSGFTLIELLVVLALMSAMVSFAAPNLWNFYTTRSEQAEVEKVIHQINHLRREYRKAGRPLILNQSDYGKEGELTLPDGWEVEQADQLRFLTNRVTNGGEIFLTSGSGKIWRVWYRPLDGNIEVSQYYAD